MRVVRNIFLALLLACMASLQTSAKESATMQKVYIFGFSASFTDSVAFLTDIQELDTAYIQSNGFLVGRSLYSMQLENYVLGKCRVPNSTNAVFFSKSKKDLMTKYNKVNRIYQRSTALTLIYVGEDEFQFKPEAYVEPTVIEEPVAAPKGAGGKGPGNGERPAGAPMGGPQGSPMGGMSGGMGPQGGTR